MNITIVKLPDNFLRQNAFLTTSEVGKFKKNNRDGHAFNQSL